MKEPAKKKPAVKKAPPKKTAKAKTAPKGKGETTTRRATNRMMQFAAEYIIDFHGTNAARRAGYTGNDMVLAAMASENLRKPQIIAEIERLTEAATSRRHQIKARVIHDLEEIAFDPDAVDVKEDREGNVLSVSRTDRIACLKLLGQHVGAFNVKIELDDPDDMAGIVIIPAKMAPEDWAARMGSRDESNE